MRKDPKPDRTKAMEWEKKRTQKQVHIQNAGTVINEINGGTFESINGEAKLMSKKKDHNESDDDFQSVRTTTQKKRKKNLSLPKNKPSKEPVNPKKDEIDVFFKSPSKQTASNLQKVNALDKHDLKHMKKIKSTKGCSKDDGANKIADVSIGTHTLECIDDDNFQEMSAYDYEKYEKSYAKMDDANKWVLTTGTVVEDALYNFGLRCKYEHLAHSFVLDPDDDTYLKENVFTKSEIHEIRNFQVKETPLMPLDLMKYLNSFNLKTTSEIRKQVFSPDPMDQDFDRSRDFDRDWIRNTIYNLLQEYESNALTTDHLELWILVHIWSFTDKAFNDIEEVKVIRGESCSLSSSARKNRERDVPAVIDMKRKTLGRRGDMIIRKITAEFGCAEAGRQFEGQNGTKLLRERGLKMPKMMKDMFNQLCGTFDQDEHKTRKLETIGFLHAGLMMVLLRLDSPAGHVCRVLRSMSYSISTHIKEFGKTLPAISLTWKAKKIVENMICLIETDESNEEDQLRRLQEIYDVTPLPSRKRKRVDLPTCLDTPSKSKSLRLSKSSGRVKEIPLGLLGPPPPFNLLSNIISCPDPQCEGENKVTAKFCSDCGKRMNITSPKLTENTSETQKEPI